MHLKQELENRWFLYQFSSEELFDLYDKWWQSFYFGVDPTADSLHLGNFVVFMNAVNYMRKWNKLYLIVGWATWMIWDPGGKNSEREFLTPEALEHNVECITKQVSGILNNLKELSGEDFDFEVINNADFYQGMDYLKFLRDVGKFITVNNMMTKETVKKRIEDPDQSISYTEFSYMLIQGYDFYRLNADYNVKLQIAGSDQWGNCVTGIELIRKKDNNEAFAMTSPLVLDSNGKKFGKSEGNAIWLDSNKSSPYSVYQYFMNTTDEDVERFLKFFTLLDFDQINEIVTKHNEDTSARYGQKKLAEYVVTTLFGESASQQAIKITEILFSNQDKLELIKGLSKEDILALQKETGGIQISEDTKILDLCTQSGLTWSNGEAKKMIQSGSIYCNEEKVEDLQFTPTKDNLVNGILLLRKGKKAYKIVIKS